MTVNQLIKHLEAIKDAGHGRKPVCIDKGDFGHVLEDDGCCILDIETVSEPRFVYTSDDDGGTKENADGSESGRMTVVLGGGWKHYMGIN